MNRKLAKTAAAAAVVVSVTLVVFFSSGTGTPKAAVDWWTLGFVLLAEVGLFCGIGVVISSKKIKKKPILGAGVVFSLFFYWMLVIALYMLTRSIFLHKCDGFIMINAVFLWICAVVISALFCAAARAD